MTAVDLRELILQLIQAHKNCQTPLSVYLRSLLSVTQSYRAIAIPSYLQIAGFFKAGFSEPAVDYQPEWVDLIYQTPVESPFEEVERILKVQIVDLVQLEASGSILLPESYFGLQSLSGRRWYNFDIGSYLERGTAFLENIEIYDEEYAQSSGWSMVGEILERGRAVE
ncbi:hypothetical protein QQ054_27935 [Oscillatoria amoena NRMC-F 0135]|nr:hypothetical protein [Geitlerinema splendidum]MDL5049847.1 hypothetical protein [Oscillatoria amoena NRMC-F 0135]